MDIVIEAIKIKDFELFKLMCNEYSPSLKRDPNFIEFMEKISNKHFDGQKIKEETGM